MLLCGKGEGQAQGGFILNPPLSGRRLGHSHCQRSAFSEGIKGLGWSEGTEFITVSPVLGGIRFAAGDSEHFKKIYEDARPRKDMGIELGHPRAFNFAIVDSELALFISTLCS